MEFFRIHRTIPFMRYSLILNGISVLTFLVAVGFLIFKGLHLSMYALLAYLTGWLRASLPVRLLLLFAITAHGGLTEWLQTWIPSRSGTPRCVCSTRPSRSTANRASTLVMPGAQPMPGMARSPAA